MQFESFSEFIHMGGHGTFVWSVYAITLLVIVGNLVLPIFQKKQFYLEQAALEKRRAPAEANPEVPETEGQG